jgi:glycosyltransferase involved in cell wall biosynthesis
MNNKITVLFPITDLELHGAQHQLLELVKNLDRECFRPLVLTLSPGGAMENEYRAALGDGLISIKRKGKFDLLYLYKVARLLRKMKVDVIQPFLTPATFYSLLPAILCRTPVKIVTERNSRKGRDIGGFGYRCYLKAEDLLTRFADWAIANSGAGRDYLIERGVNPNHTWVIYNGIDLSGFVFDNEDVAQIRQQFDIPPDKQVIGMIARLHPIKRHDIFLRAAAIVHREIPGTKFAILGDGPLRSQLENLTQELGLSSQVIFCGEQQNTYPYTAAFDIVAMSSDSEGLSLSLCEAMALGKPIVATDAGGNKELVENGETGFIVPLGDAESLAEAMLRLIRDPDLARAMGQRAKEKIATQFSPKKYVTEYQTLYEETLRQKKNNLWSGV